MMTKEKLESFLNEESTSRDDWKSCMNFIYTGNDSINSPTDYIKKIQDADTKLEIDGWNFRSYKKWKTCVKEDVIKHKECYINKLLTNDDNPIKYIIFSEAPKLTWKKGNDPSSAYIFGEKPVSGNYKSAPLAAFDAKKKKIIDTFKDKRVAFIDLLDLPLPINGELRRNWNYKKEMNISGKPLTIFFLENAIQNFITKAVAITNANPKRKQLKFAADVNFAFMMPPLTSMGIIEYFNKTNTSLDITHQGINVFLAKERIVECNTINTKSIKNNLESELLPLYVRVAMSGSNTPSEKLLKHALNLI